MSPMNECQDDRLFMVGRSPKLIVDESAAGPLVFSIGPWTAQTSACE
jgi:hypothetical protein